jgi:hypothetical protein
VSLEKKKLQPKTKDFHANKLNHTLAFSVTLVSPYLKLCPFIQNAVPLKRIRSPYYLFPVRLGGPAMKSVQHIEKKLWKIAPY